MGTHLHEILRSLCLNTEWKYAVFWKLKHRARMVLTWEDAYYDNHEQHDPLENKCSSGTPVNFDGHYSHDPLGLAVAKMSYHVYSLGEGIVGQVAVTGKHQWIFADKHITNSCSSFEHCDGWQTQFLAGIRTIVVVAIVPHGVVQLGSLNKVSEDLKLLNHIRDVFLALQDSFMGHIYSPIQYNINSYLCLPDISTRVLGSEVCVRNLDKAANKERPNVWSPMFPSLEKDSDGSSYFVPLSGIHQKKVVEGVNKRGGLKSPMSVSDEVTKLFQPNSEIFVLERQKEIQMKLLNDRKCVGESSGWRDAGVGFEPNVTPYSQDVHAKDTGLHNVASPADNPGVAFPYFPSDLLDSSSCEIVKFDGVDRHQDGVLHIRQTSGMQVQKDLEKLDFQTELSHIDTSNVSFKFSAGCELHEALGPAFLKRSLSNDWEMEKAEGGTTVELPEGMNSSHLTSDSGSENLLEAVVANVCPSSSDAKSEKSFCKSVDSLLMTENMPEPSSHTKDTICSASHSIDQPAFVEKDTQHSLNSSEVCVVRSPRGFSSTCPSSCSEQLERSLEPAKSNKKRARPGENCRPRPRDRQLIQDRIKELRELVPNGSKCSIDSLLERTIKHMLFLQSITKHADKLKKCAESKVCNKEKGILGSSSYEQGSSWAVEVGSHLKVCTIIVENLNMNGQMLVEMVCEECSHFLEIAEAIRSLGLTILKGVTEARGEKTWICFVVEGQNNRNMHRMDILWSLVQILQPKTAV
ncbi:hypothetical protein L1049_003616 [Liquidambar formosana]|uniref:BHLH domain-containing protein n=1 Tax=Liquidambar formosana TaxID=63359 RepID=A0AAP0RMS8_LIQFO